MQLGSSAPGGQGPQRRVWVVGLLAFIVTLAAPLLAVAAMTDESPEVRVVPTDGRISALVADGAVRVLILNSTDPRTARSMLGAGRPWEPRPQVIIAPADDDAATGLLAVLDASEPDAVIVAGLPGADPAWHALEQACAVRGIELEYTVESMRIDAEQLNITVIGAGLEDGSVVVVRRNDSGTTVAIALDRGAPAVRAHALVTSGAGDAANVDLVVTTSAGARRVTHDEVVLGLGIRSTIVLERDEIAVFGGTYRARSEDNGR